MTLNYDIAVDLTPEFNRQLSPKFSVSLGDHGAREYTVQILQDGEPFVIEEGSTVSIVGKKSDGHIFAYACTYFDSFVRFTIEEQMTPVSGIVTCELSIIDASGNKVGSANFTYWVEPSPVTDGEASESDLQLFQQAVDAAGDVQRILDTFGGPNVAQKAEDMINTSKVYVYIGDETGFEYGHWYYYDTAASTWADGGIYQSDGVNTDKTLTTSGVPADAKATGDALAAKQDTLTFDSTPTEGSTNPVTSGGVWEAANVKVDKDGVGQVTPQNIEGVTVTGGNIIDDAERLYSTQLGTQTTDGYVVIANGAAIIQASSPFCSFLVPIKPNTHYTANHSIRFAVLLNNLATDGTTPVRYSTVIGSALANILAFDSGEADHIIVSWNYNTYPIDSFVISEGDTPTADKTITLPDWWTGGSTPTVVEKPKFATVTGDMVSGGNLQLPSERSNLRKGERIVFEGNITNFSTLTIGLTRFTYDLGNNANSRNIFVIDGTNITYKAYPTATAVTVPHGLTISENIQIIWEMTATASCKITLISDGVLFSHEFTNFVRQVIGNPFVYSADSELTGCKLTWTCTDINKSIWMFGDSYFGYAESRWTYYLHQYGYDNNCLLDGFPGEGGVNGRVAFSNLLQFGTPKFAVWCLGMNDTADSESAPATAWVTNRDYFLRYCTQNNIIPIFGTIPTVPSINHEQKNAWIRSSGYRYIDFAKAVGASASGVWFSGMLSSDNVHPTPQGARALFARVLLDLPEIMLDGTN